MSELFQPFVAAFEGFGDRLRDGVGGWEVRFENPPGAYLHPSKPKWGDQQWMEDGGVFPMAEWSR